MSFAKEAYQMFEKTQKAAVDLSAAVTEDANQAVNMAKAMVVPAVAGLFGALAGYASKIKADVESGEFVNRAKAETSSAAAKARSRWGVDPKGAEKGPDKAPSEPKTVRPPTEEEEIAIRAMRLRGQDDEEIAHALGLHTLTVKMAALR